MISIPQLKKPSNAAIVEGLTRGSELKAPPHLRLFTFAL